MQRDGAGGPAGRRDLRLPRLPCTGPVRLRPRGGHRQQPQRVHLRRVDLPGRAADDLPAGLGRPGPAGDDGRHVRGGAADHGRTAGVLPRVLPCRRPGRRRLRSGAPSAAARGDPAGADRPGRRPGGGGPGRPGIDRDLRPVGGARQPVRPPAAGPRGARRGPRGGLPGARRGDGGRPARRGQGGRLLRAGRPGVPRGADRLSALRLRCPAAGHPLRPGGPAPRGCPDGAPGHRAGRVGGTASHRPGGGHLSRQHRVRHLHLRIHRPSQGRRRSPTAMSCVWCTTRTSRRSGRGTPSWWSPRWPSTPPPSSCGARSPTAAGWRSPRPALPPPRASPRCCASTG